MTRIEPAHEAINSSVEPVALSRVLARAPEALQSFDALADATKNADVSPLAREIVALTAFRRSPTLFAWRRSLNSDIVSDALAQAVLDENYVDARLDQSVRALLHFALLFDGGLGVGDRQFEAVRGELGDERTVALAATCAHWGAVARLCKALSVEP